MSEETKTTESTGKTFNLFVYGTLKTTGNPGVMFKGLKTATATVHGTMHNIGNKYPGVVFGGENCVCGQVILDIPEIAIAPDCGVEEEMLKYLDTYEGALGMDPLYRRITIKVYVDGKEIEAFAYEAAEMALKYSKGIIASGDWDAFRKSPCDCRQKHSCKLTGGTCPYSGWEDDESELMTGFCTLKAYADKHPENGVQNEVLGEIASFFRGCMTTCSVLAHHYHMLDCGTCGGMEHQLRLRYLAHCYKGNGADRNEKEST